MVSSGIILMVLLVFCQSSQTPVEENICHCLRYSATEGFEWGDFQIIPQDLPNNTECIIIFIVAANNEIVELRFEDIQLRQRCLDEIRIYPHLKNTIITDTTPYEDVICANNCTQYFSSNTSISGQKFRENSTSHNGKLSDVKKRLKLAEGNIFHILLVKKAIFSSDSVMAIQIFHHNVTSFTSESFSLSGKFRYISKDAYRTTGNLLSTTYCDYQFLPHSTTFARENKYENAIFRTFYSPRFPAKYPNHVKCLYKFIGRQLNKVEIIFDGIILQRDNRSCINHLDKITVYDSKTLNKSTTIDVFCDVKWNKRILSTGPYLLIEFETSSNESSYGFSAKYRFIETEEKINIINNQVYLRTTEATSSTPVTVESLMIVNEHSPLSSKSYQPTCDSYLKSSVTKNGTVQSPMFLGSYPSNAICRYEFIGTDKERVQISFSEFSLASEENRKVCGDENILQVYESIRRKYELVDVLCGKELPKPIMSRGTNLLLEFHGFHSGNSNKGFKAEYAFLTNYGIRTGLQRDDHPCSFSYNSNGTKSGWFYSPNFPGAYPRNIECLYDFLGSANEKVSLRFTYFDVEGIFPCDEDTASDYVEFSNFKVQDRRYRRYCGQKKSFVIKSEGRFFRVTFRSNDLLDGIGFKAFYAFESDKASENIITEVGSNAICIKLSSNIWMFLVVFFALFYKCIKLIK